MARTTNKRGLSKDTTKKQGKTSSASGNHASHQLCKRCSRRFGSKACAKRLCGSCCPLGASAGGHGPCVAHLSLRKAAKRRQGAYLLVASVNRLKREESSINEEKKKKKGKKSKKSERLAKRMKTQESLSDEDDDEEADVVANTWGDGADSLGALVAVQAEEIARLRRELKLTRHAHERLKRKRVKVEQGLCIICEERALNVLLVPCGHCYCRECVDQLRSCPVCRTAVRKRYSYHPPAYVCDDAVLAMVPPLPSAKLGSGQQRHHQHQHQQPMMVSTSRVTALELEDDDDDASSSSSAPSSPSAPDTEFEFVMRRRSAANPHRVLFV